MGSFARSWKLAKESAAVLMADKELFFFPILSAIVSFIAVIILSSLLAGVGLFVPGAADALAQSGDDDGSTLIGLIILFLFYLVTSFIVTYFTGGLVGAALIRLRGGDPGFGDGIRIANQRVGAIFMYSVMAATVGVLSSVIRGRGSEGNMGRSLLAGLTEAAWNIASFLAIPIIVSGPVSALEAVKQSALMLKKTWGEQIVGTTGIGLVFLIPYILIIPGGILAMIALANAGWGAGIWTVLILMILATILLAVLQSALTGIYKAAIYLYAVEEVETPAFDSTLLQTAFKPSAA
jgi:hypothetical protein